MGHIELNLSNIKLCLGAAEVSAAYLGSEQVYPQSQSSDIPNYLSFTNKGTDRILVYFEHVNGNQQPHHVFYYSWDGIDWDSWDNAYMSSNYAVPIESNETLYLCGDNSTINYMSTSVDGSVFLRFKFITSENDLHPAIEAHGNIMSLLSKTGFESLTSVPAGCFSSLFKNCTLLTTAPELPATTLEKYAYYNIFYGCTSLTTAPELPATTLEKYAYCGMFQRCTSLTTAPTLPATTLGTSCYAYMFTGCTSLTTGPTLPATTLAEACYDSMFQGCTLLTTAPTLPAITLVDFCYSYMFKNCTSLNYINFGALDISATNCVYEMLSGVSSNGTFVKSTFATWTESNIVPSGWTIETASS